MWEQDASPLLLLQENCFSSTALNPSPKHQGENLCCSKQQKLPSSLIPQTMQENLHWTEWRHKAGNSEAGTDGKPPWAHHSLAMLSEPHQYSLTAFLPSRIFRAPSPEPWSRQRCATGTALPCHAHFPNLSSQTKQAIDFFGEWKQGNPKSLGEVLGQPGQWSDVTQTASTWVTAGGILCLDLNLDYFISKPENINTNKQLLWPSLPL